MIFLCYISLRRPHRENLRGFSDSGNLEADLPCRLFSHKFTAILSHCDWNGASAIAGFVVDSASFRSLPVNLLP